MTKLYSSSLGHVVAGTIALPPIKNEEGDRLSVCRVKIIIKRAGIN